MFTHSRHRLQLSDRRTWDDDLLDAQRYHALFDSLRARAGQKPSLLAPPRRTGAIGLRWILAHEDLVIDRILESLVTPGFELGTQRKVRVFAGKSREIYVAEWPDRLVLMAAARILSERMEDVLSDRVFSFRKGRSHWDALRQLRVFLRTLPASRPVHILKRDISKYGDSIDPGRALALARSRLGLLPDSLFERVLRQGLAISYEADGGTKTLDHGVPSGSPLCPPLENLYLDGLDRLLAALPDVFYARYGDDFLLATESEAVAAEARETIARTVAEVGLVISPDKAQDVTLTGAGQGLEWLGFRVGRDGRLGAKRKRWRETRRRMTGEVERFVRVAFRAGLEEPQRLALLREGIRRLLEPAGSPWLASMVFEQDDPHSLRALDQHLTRALADGLGKQLGAGRHEGWRLFRKLGYRSLLHARAERRWG